MRFSNWNRMGQQLLTGFSNVRLMPVAEVMNHKRARMCGGILFPIARTRKKRKWGARYEDDSESSANSFHELNSHAAGMLASECFFTDRKLKSNAKTR